MKKYSQDIIEATRRCIDIKWVPIRNGVKIDGGNSDCPLCKAGKYCTACPLYNNSSCCNGLYSMWQKYFGDNKYYKGSMRVIDKESKEIANSIVSYIEDVYKEISKKEVFYRIGDKFYHTIGNSQRIYTLNSVSTDEVNLNKENGSRWGTSPIKVYNCYKITEEEFSQFMEYDKFTKLEDEKCIK